MTRRALIAIAMAIAGCKQAQPPATTGSAGSAPPAGSGGGATSPATGSGGSGATGSGSGTAGSPPATKPAAGGKPLRETLAEAAGGKPVLLVLDAKGQLIARTTDGGTPSVLLPGPYGDALHDSALDLVWLRRDTGLDVLDLRAPGPATAKTLATAPDKVLEKLGEHIVEPPHWDMTQGVFILLNTGCSKGTGLTLDWSKGGVGTTTGSEGVKVVAKDWFAAEEHRMRREQPPGFTQKLTKPHKVPKGIGTCHTDAKGEFGKDECGHGLVFGATGAELVVVGANPDKCPTRQCQLYDPATRKYAPVPGIAADDPEAPSCGPFLFDTAGTSYLVDDKLCTGQSCSSVGKLAIGWLDADRVLNAN